MLFWLGCFIICIFKEKLNFIVFRIDYIKIVGYIDVRFWIVNILVFLLENFKRCRRLNFGVYVIILGRRRIKCYIVFGIDFKFIGS